MSSTPTIELNMEIDDQVVRAPNWRDHSLGEWVGFHDRLVDDYEQAKAELGELEQRKRDLPGLIGQARQDRNRRQTRELEWELEHIDQDIRRARQDALATLWKVHRAAHCTRMRHAQDYEPELELVRQAYEQAKADRDRVEAEAERRKKLASGAAELERNVRSAYRSAAGRQLVNTTMTPGEALKQPVHKLANALGDG